MRLQHTVLFLALALSLAAHATCPFGLLSPSPYDANQKAGDVTSGDFNHDGYVDLAVMNRTLKTISILLGTAGGGFAAPTTINTDYSQDDILAADFNKDGNLDLVFAVPTSNNPEVHSHLQLLLGNGNGTFTAVPYTDQQSVFQNPSRMVLGDFNKDGYIDVATTKSGGEWSSVQNVNGNLFSPKASYTTGNGGVAVGIAAGDFDGDGKTDIAVAESFSSKKVWLFYGVGDGTFTKSQNTIDFSNVSDGLKDVEAGDFNGDGKDDLAVIMDGSPSPLKICLSNGVARTFASPVDYGSFSSGQEMLVKDMDGDGKLDILIAFGSGLLLFRGNGDGTFAAQQGFGSRFSLGLAVDDFDRDGGPDVVTAAFINGQVDVFLNACGRVTVNLTSSANPAVQGTPIDVTATVVSPPAAAATGTFVLKRGTTVLNSGNLNAGNSLMATMNGLSPGTYTLSAEYSGDSRFLALTKTLDQVVTVPPFGPPPGLNALSFGGPVQISWIATANTDHYEVQRNNGAGWVTIGAPSIAAFTDSSAPSNAALLYRVRAVTGASTSEYGNPDLAITYVFTDGTLQAGVTTIKAAHLTELRSAANAVRAVTGLPPATWTDSSPTLIRAGHVNELRTAIDQARAMIGLPAWTYTDTITGGTTTRIKAVHFDELRSAMR